MRTFSRFLAAAASLACAASLAVAAERTVLGRSLTVEDPKPGVDATRRNIRAVGKEKNSPETLVGNPTLAGDAGGAVLQVFAFGGTSSNQAFVLPQGTSSSAKPFWTAAGTTGYEYKDSKGDQGPVKAVSIKRSASGAFTIKAKVAAKNGPVDVVPPNPGTSGCVALKLGIGGGAGDRYSLQFGPDSQIKNSGAKLFKAMEPSLESVCPAGAITVRSVPPGETDPGIDARAGDHLVAVPAPGTSIGRLLLFFPGTAARPDQYTSLVRRAAELGYHSLSLDYENSRSINFQVCPGQPPDCHEAARLEILTGAESPYIEPDVDATNAAFNRLTQLLVHQHATHPEEGWDAYLANGEPRWDRIAVGGHSQGGGHAAMTAKLHEVDRALLFGATEPAPWTLEPIATPAGRFWGLVHTQEPIFNGITLSWTNLALPGALVEIELTPPEDSSHRLATTFSECGGDPTSNGYFHNCYIVDGWMPPPGANGTPVFAPIWDHMLTAPSG